jgi:hypothetical protein
VLNSLRVWCPWSECQQRVVDALQGLSAKTGRRSVSSRSQTVFGVCVFAVPGWRRQRRWATAQQAGAAVSSHGTPAEAQAAKDAPCSSRQAVQCRRQRCVRPIQHMQWPLWLQPGCGPCIEYRLSARALHRAVQLVGTSPSVTGQQFSQVAVRCL